LLVPVKLFDELVSVVVRFEAPPPAAPAAPVVL